MSEGEATAALFPGQGSQAVGMAHALYDASPAAKRALDEAEGTLPGLLSLMWEGPAEQLQLTANQQPALVAAGAAAYAAYLEAGGPQPSFAAGHSLGEFSAHVAAGSLTLSDAVRLVRKRGSYMQDAVPKGQGAMAAVLQIAPETVAQTCRETAGTVEVANLNSPQQTVISGAAEAVARASERLKSEGARVIPLKVSAPFHSSLMQPAAEALARDLEQAEFSQPQLTIVCNVTAEPLPGPESAPRLLTEQVTSAVRWVESVERLAQLGAAHFLEFGSGKVLTGLVGRILPTTEAHAIADPNGLKEAL